MLRISISMQTAADGRPYLYNTGDMTVVFNLDRTLSVSDDYSFMIFNEQLMLMGDARKGDDSVRRHGHRSFAVNMASPGVWMPGRYFVLVRCNDARVLRSDFVLYDDGSVNCEPVRCCNRLGVEDILSGPLSKSYKQWWMLSRLLGNGPVKRWLISRLQQNELNRMRATEGHDDMLLCSNLLIATDATAFVRFTLKGLAEIGKLSGRVKMVNCEDLHDVTRAFAYEQLDNLLGRSVDDDYDLISDDGTTYCFSNLGALLDPSGKIVLKKIVDYCFGRNNAVIFCGKQQEVDGLLAQAPSLNNLFPADNRLSMGTVTCEELVQSFLIEARQAGLKLSAEATDCLCRKVVAAYHSGALSHWRVDHVRSCVRGQLMPQYCSRTLGGMGLGMTDASMLYVQPAEVRCVQLEAPSTQLDDTLRELNNMVGLADIKQSINTLSNHMRFYTMRRQLGLTTTGGAVYHAIFTGNPGTGKTTVARMLGRIYHSLGLLSRGEVVCVDRARMIGRYIGETEENMQQILREARGNVLFVDEAYTLYSTGDDKDFGRHALECLLDVLAQKNPDMLVVFAGYAREMDKLMSMNPGLVGRFPYKFHFTDYDDEELMEIACKLLAHDQYELAPEARELLHKTIRQTVMTRSEHFANARWVEQYVRNGIVPALADRVCALPVVPDRRCYQLIESVDIMAAYQMFNARTLELRSRNTIGFRVA